MMCYAVWVGGLCMISYHVLGSLKGRKHETFKFLLKIIYPKFLNYLDDDTINERKHWIINIHNIHIILRRKKRKQIWKEQKHHEGNILLMWIIIIIIISMIAVSYFAYHRSLLLFHREQKKIIHSHSTNVLRETTTKLRYT